MPENRRRFRNPVARSPLLRKGGPHQPSRSGERHNQRQALEAELDAWRDEYDDLMWQTDKPEPKGPGSSLYRPHRNTHTVNTP
jgi:hypothetical protein